MSQQPTQSATVAPSTEPGGSLPSVELEVSHAGRTTTYILGHVDFLIGTVPGCDLRVPGVDLPPILCLLARHPGGVALRKLAPTQLLLVNGKTAARAELEDGDRITLGATDVFVRIKSLAEAPRDHGESTEAIGLHDQLTQFRAQVVRFREERQTFDKLKEQEQRAWDERRAELELRERAAQERVAALGQSAAAASVPRDVELAQKLRQVEVQSADLEKQRQELASMRQELADIRRQLYDRYQERRDRLAGLQEAVDRAARKMQERKRLLDAEEEQSRQRRQEDAKRRAELDARASTLEEQKARLEDERRLLHESHAAVQADLEKKLGDLHPREEKVAGEQRDLDGRLRQYQADLVRLDRLQGSLDERDKKFEEQIREQQAKFAELEAASADLEEQAVQVDSARTSLQQEADGVARQKERQDALAADLAQRSAAVEGQQTTLALLRTKLERMRDDVRAQEQELDKERGRQQLGRGELDRDRQGVTELRAQLDIERQLGEQERRQLAERGAVLEGALARLGQSQEKLAEEDKKGEERAEELDRRAALIAEQKGTVEGRLRQLAEAQERLDLERQTLRERTQALAQTELAREALQEQLRKRSEDLAGRHKALNEKMQDYEAQAAAIEARKAEAERQVQEANELLGSWRQEQAAQVETLQARQDEQARREAHHREQFEQLRKLGRDIAQERKALGDERAATRQEQEAWLERMSRNQGQFDALKQEAVGLARQLPDVELRAGTALERLTHAREQLRDHLTELHAYVQDSREDLENGRGRLQREEARLHEQEQALRRSQEEHRLAMVAFRQQMIGWQGQIVDLRRLLAKDETRLERRQTIVDEQAKEIGAASEKLAQKAEALQQEQHEVAGKRQEMDRHLVDMREWYRLKLRELAGVDAASSGELGEPETTDVVPMPLAEDGDGLPTLTGIAEEDAPVIPSSRDILSLTEPADAGDAKLGEVLTRLELVDGATLTALLVEARRQRRSLRQALLASNVVTLYQLALIEAGNVEGLMLGPVRVIDRLRVTPHETVYRVFDPRRGCEAVLRHLSEEDMLDAVRPDEFKQRFAQAQIASPHLAATLEVLDIAGRPAAIQEWLSGLPSSDWPPLAAAPGVCFRLFTQAALALDVIHKAGLTHGNVGDGSILLSSDGTLKIAGVGEPAWLRANSGTDERHTPADDLQSLGKVVSGWCTTTAVRRGPKTKPLPDGLLTILYRLAAGGANGYASAAQLLEDLDHAGREVPANAEAWDRLLRHVREHAAPEALVNRSA